MPALPVMPRRVINAWGTATPFGVSRCDAAVAQAAADMLGRYVVMAELQALAGERIARWSGAQAACVTHCTAAALTLSAAACMAGSDADADRAASRCARPSASHSDAGSTSGELRPADRAGPAAGRRAA
jgi:hypothetical protein